MRPKALNAVAKGSRGGTQSRPMQPVLELMAQLDLLTWDGRWRSTRTWERSGVRPAGAQPAAQRCGWVELLFGTRRRTG